MYIYIYTYIYTHTHTYIHILAPSVPGPWRDGVAAEQGWQQMRCATTNIDTMLNSISNSSSSSNNIVITIIILLLLLVVVVVVVCGRWLQCRVLGDTRHKKA